MFFKHRVARNRFLYFCVLILILAVFAYLVDLYNWSLFELAIIGIAFLVPGRLVQYFWRDFFAGRKLLEKGSSEEAQRVLAKFLESVREFPWIKWLMFFTYGLYSFKVEAVTLTYLGEAHLRQGHLDKAGLCFDEALRIDSKYSVAMFNLAVLYHLKSNASEARLTFELARQHGYPRMTFDQFELYVKERYSKA